MKGGVGRYTCNLFQALKKKGIDVNVAIGENKKIIDNFNNNLKIYNDAHIRNNSQSILENNIKNRDCIYTGIIKKGDPKNSDRLLHLVNEIKPDIVNIQYERGLYENDTSIRQMIRRLLHGSTLHKFFKNCPVATISTLHTVMPYDEYKEYIKDRIKRKEGRFTRLPLPIRSFIRKWALERRYDLLFEIVKISDSIISLSQTTRKTIEIGSVIYHGSEPYPSLSLKNKQDYRKEFKLPLDKKLLLAFGYVGSYKGFDILDDIRLPKEWNLVIKQNKHERGNEKPFELKNAINLHLGYLDDMTLSKLFFACDAIIFPYLVVSVSGVLFDALAHELPFIASDLSFFKEFSNEGLGITCSRNSVSFSEAIERLAKNYSIYKNRINQFKLKLQWDRIADEHITSFQKIISKN
jgi:glycosyltransferase involved in cell wall biosynthesis